ncbi:MAG: murein L,D-transpeptidase catalytic domain family protein [Bacteriovorax sp.]|nr:murein L,D-transpeptidase catalytic domain family protein [Bacteriovorax sp.]
MILKSNRVIGFFCFFLMSVAHADYLSWDLIETKFKEERLNPKIISHVKCFFEKYEDRQFVKKIPFVVESNDLFNRCESSTHVSIGPKRVFAVVDFTIPSNEKRMILVDRLTGKISLMAVAHGRYLAGMFNHKLSSKKNSVKDATEFSNVINSNAPSSGFFIAGTDYIGKFGRSLVLHGLEKGVNDNACEREVVLHKHFLVSNSKAHILSRGCFMINKDNLDDVINLLKGEASIDGWPEKGGALIFAYGPREAGWGESTCGEGFDY